MSYLTLNNVSKTFPNGVQALADISLAVEVGAFVVIIGPSGCGKSTLLRVIAGLEAATAGDIMLDGRRVNDEDPGGRDLAMVFQSYALYPHMTVRGNMEYGLRRRRLSAEEIKNRIAEAAGILQLEALLDRKPAQLSGGQRQRVAMGRAIVRKPKAFLLDEPLSNLDAHLRAHMRGELKGLHHRLATSFLYVTHDQAEAMSLGDVIVVLNEGRIEQIGTPHELYAKPANLFVAHFIGSPGMNIVAMPKDGKAGEAAYIGFRPEVGLLNVAGSKSGHGVGKGDMAFAGRVASVDYVGSDYFVHIALASVQTVANTRKIDSDSLVTIRAKHRVGQKLAAGDKAEVVVEDAQLCRFDGDGKRLG